MEILLNIKSEYLRKYLEYLFEKKGDVFIVNRTIPFGRECCTKFSKSSLPKKIEKSEQTVTLRLPKSCNANNIEEKYYIYYDKFSAWQLNESLKCISDMDFREYCISGREKKILQKDIIDAYIYSRKLVLNNDTNEMLKKRHYRNEEKQLNEMRKLLLNRSYNFNKKIKYNITN